MDSRRYGGIMIELARRRMMMGGSAKPYDAEVEWIASDGNTVVDTLIAPNTLTNYHLVFSNWAKKRDVNFFAALDVKDNVSRYYRELSVGHADSMRSQYGTSARDAWLPTSNIANVKFSITKIGFAIIYHNYSTGLDYATTLTPSIYQWTDTLKFFGTDIYPAMNMSARLYPSYLTDENGNKIGDYIPVRKNGEGYLYDKISKQLLPNIGPGLSFGPDK